MLRVWSDVLTSADVRDMTLLGLLDLSAAFDCVDHDILLHGLEVAFGLTNTALEWIRSFLTDRRRAGTDRRAPRPTSTHVRRRLPGVPKHVHRRCSSGS